MRIVDSRRDPELAIEVASSVLAAGGVAALPTDTLYGLAVRAGDHAGLARLFEIKRRPAERNVAVLVSGRAQVDELGAVATPELAGVMTELWPGGVTVILDTADGTLGVRSPEHQWLLDLLAVTGPLATTSANIHGEPPMETAAEIAACFADDLDVVVDGGSCSGDASTVVAYQEGALAILRHGAVDEAVILAAARDGGGSS